jgi:hypothetical protein
MACSTHCYQGEYKYGCKYGDGDKCGMFPGVERLIEMMTLDLMNIFEKNIDSKYLNFTRNKTEYSELVTQLCFISWRTGYENSDKIYDELYGDY